MRRLLPLLLLASCHTERQWQSAFASQRVEVGSSNGGSLSNENAHKRSYSMDGDWIAWSIQPFAGFEPAREVIVVQPPEVKPK